MTVVVWTLLYFIMLWVSVSPLQKQYNEVVAGRQTVPGGIVSLADLAIMGVYFSLKSISF